LDPNLKPIDCLSNKLVCNQKQIYYNLVINT
jgi:hypothetical protein